MAEHEHAPAVSVLELFYDLVFVVAIHDVATGLETEATLWPDPVSLFLLRMFLVWSIWHRWAAHMNVALQIHHRALRAYHYVCVLLLLACMSFSSRAVKGNEDRTLLVLFGVQVWLQVALICVEAVVARGKERDFLLTMLKIMVPPTVLETILVALAAYFADGTAVPSLQCRLCWAAVAVLFLGTRTFAGCVMACSDPAKLPPVLFDEEHFQERYQLIMLIVMGEVVAAGAGVVSGSVSAIALPLSAIVTAFLCFLIAFVAQPAARRNPWACGHASRVHAPHAYLAMACSLAALGPAFARIVEEAGRHSKGPDEGEGASEGNEPSSGDAARADGCASVGLLYLSVGGFLIASASVHALGEDRAPSRCASSTRAAVQAILGLLMCVLVLVPGCNANLAAALVPGLLAPLTLFQFWASAKAGAAADGHLQQPGVGSAALLGADERESTG